MNPIATESNRSSERRYDLDGLRIFAVLLLIYFHTAAIFYRGSLGEFYVTDAQKPAAIRLFIEWVHQWHMPVFFFLSGAAMQFSLRVRTATQYVVERFQRLFVPFVFGTLAIVPLQVYYHLRQLGYDGSYPQFYPQFFNGIRPAGNFEWAHLWFIVYLLVLSIVALPLFIYLNQLKAADFPLRLAKFLESPIALPILALPLALIEASLRPRWIGFQNLYDDWANVSLYLVYLVYGYLLSAEPQFQKRLDRDRGKLAGLAIAGMSLLLALWSSNLIPEPGYSFGYMLYQAFRGFNSWCWVVFLLSLAQRYLNFTHPLLRYCNEAAYPFYILHQTVIVAIGYYVVQWQIGVVEKFIVISTVSLAATLLVYDLLVKRSPLTRFLFGLKQVAH